MSDYDDVREAERLFDAAGTSTGVGEVASSEGYDHRASRALLSSAELRSNTNSPAYATVASTSPALNANRVASRNGSAAVGSAAVSPALKEEEEEMQWAVSSSAAQWRAPDTPEIPSLQSYAPLAGKADAAGEATPSLSHPRVDNLVGGGGAASSPGSRRASQTSKTLQHRKAAHLEVGQEVLYSPASPSENAVHGAGPHGSPVVYEHVEVTVPHPRIQCTVPEGNLLVDGAADDEVEVAEKTIASSQRLGTSGSVRVSELVMGQNGQVPGGASEGGSSALWLDGDSEDGEGSWPKQPCASCCVHSSDPDSWRENRPRRHAFQWPMNSLQIGALTMLFVAFSLFWSSVGAGYIMLYYMDHENCYSEMVAILIIHSAAIISVVSAWATVSFKDCTDREDVGEFCAFCRRRTSPDAKHCKACNKCVSNFDHHCKWLNMCIGAQNYKIFIWFLVSTLAVTSFSIIFSLVFLVRWWGPLRQNHGAYFVVAPIILVFLMTAVLGMVTHLFGFHVFLRMNGLTTYQHIMRKREAAFSLQSEDAKPPRKSGLAIPCAKKSKS